MGDSIEGSSSAAQSAQDDVNDTLDDVSPATAPEEEDDATGQAGGAGLFRRLLDALSPNDPDDGDAAQDRPSSGVTQLTGMMNLRRKRVEDVAIPKAEIVSVPDTITQEELVQVFRDTGMTRLPVYTGTLDTPIGIAHLKDFALKHGFNGQETEFSLKKLLRPLLFVPPSMPIGILLQKMQSERRHMALVIDEYGGVDGLLTIEDLIEQVIGEIEDEHDVDEGQYWTRERAGTYLALARTPLEDFEAEIQMSLTDHEAVDEEEIDTLGGLVFMLAGRVPVRGEVVRHPAGPEFEVLDADPRRVKRLRVRLAQPDDG